MHRASLLVMLAALTHGCGKPEKARLAVYPVAGKLLVNGKPAEPPW